jgi:D-methionine transport system ATP-binding protein
LQFLTKGDVHLIRLQNISKVFYTDSGPVEALKDINLSIKKGEIFGIIGLSGAGKSTLVRCINFLEKPTEGNVILDGRDLGGLTRKELLKARQSIGMIFQGFNLLSQRNALRNICFPLEIAGVSKSDAKARAYELLDIVGLSDKAKAYPSQLSGGQMQRVAIARALATNPKVLLCDEATSALDPNTTQSILELLKDINRKFGVTIVVITHEMKVIEQICNRVAVIDRSRIVEQGDVREVFMRPKSDIAKQLILPKSEAVEFLTSRRCLRIVFDGNSSFEPIISNMTLECHAVVNILFADTKNIDGKAFGQMVLQLPDDDTAIERIKAYLESKNILYKEEYLNA